MARSFSVSTDKIVATTPNPSGFSALTLAGWFNGQAATGVGYQAVMAYNSNFGIWWRTGLSPAKLAVYLGPANGHDPCSQTIVAGAWYHVAVSAPANGSAAVYINGVLDSTFGAPATFPSATSIEFGNDTSVEWMYGLICEQAIWNAALTALEISALASGIRACNIRPGSLQGYYPIGGLQSPEPDLSGNANNGTLTGTAPAANPPFTAFTPRWHRVPPLTAPAFTLMPQIVT